MVKKKTKEDQLRGRLFGHLKPERVQVDLANVVERLAEEPRRPIPKKRLVPKKILAIEPDQRCSDILAKNWDKLREMVMIKEMPCRTFRGYNSEDVLHETYEYVIRDEQVKGATEEEIANLFRRRFDNLMWSAKMDKALERQILARGEIDPVTFGSDNEKTK
jgi:hypothetical protein